MKRDLSGMNQHLLKDGSPRTLECIDPFDEPNWSIAPASGRQISSAYSMAEMAVGVRRARVSGRHSKLNQPQTRDCRTSSLDEGKHATMTRP